ncbi:FecR domain-containing protein [Pseudomonas ovata]|uniref:FecR domain-containing protein n=1 Tax=Pseudomonas ovata TaxID=1839709 RepID=UPI000D69623C|nr:FecR domain-containing protein [Pseudomonas ovata]
MMEAPISRDVARQAAHWLMLMHDGPLSASQQQACDRWRCAEPEHERAWQRVQRVQQQLGLLPPPMAMGTLNRQRRQALKTLLVLAAVLPAGYLGYRSAPWREWTADYRTAVGERRQIELADGSLLDLNTDTAVDVHFSAQQRLIRLLRGELLIKSGADRDSPVHRPLSVESRDGRMQALGTRFSVRQREAQTQLAVFEGQVRASPKQGVPRVVSAGEQVRFNATGIGPTQTAIEQDTLWSKGRLIADDMPLEDFIRELGRYRPGLLRCDPSIRGLHISGGFQLDNTDAILAALPTTLPVQVLARTRYWVTVKSAGP